MIRFHTLVDGNAYEILFLIVLVVPKNPETNIISTSFSQRLFQLKKPEGNLVPEGYLVPLLFREIYSY